MPAITDRRTQAAQGYARFYTGKRCIHGHDAERFVSNGGCVECINVKRARKTTDARNVRFPDKPFTLAAGLIKPGEESLWDEIFEILRGWTKDAYLAAVALRKNRVP